jgi:hypothetical protein
MSEIDLNQAAIGWINLAYTSGQWWITVTTALVVATYLGAKHIPTPLFGLIVALYILTAISVLFEFKEYGDLAISYGLRMSQLRAQNHEFASNLEPSAILRWINGWTNYAIFALGTVGAIAFSFLHWRQARSA